MRRSPNALLAALLLLAPLTAQEQAGTTVPTLPDRPRPPSKEFYELKLTLDQLRQQMNQLRVDVEASRSRELTPEIYRSILKRLALIRLSHEIILTNGTVVRGNILAEDLDQISLETTLGTLILKKSTIRSIEEIADTKPKVEFMGDAEEEFFTGYRIFEGRVRNDGITRADFVRVVFKLWDARSELVAQDSAFVAGQEMTYLSGVAADTAVEPGQAVSYHVRVNVEDNAVVSYMTREVHWEQVE